MNTSQACLSSQPDLVSPTQRKALAAALDASNNTLVRVRGGYAADRDQDPVNIRTINALQALGLIEPLDAYRDRLRLTRRGVAVAEGRA